MQKCDKPRLEVKKKRKKKRPNCVAKNAQKKQKHKKFTAKFDGPSIEFHSYITW